MADQGVCLTDCPTGYYNSETLNNIMMRICLACPKNCTSCLSNISCDNCADNFYQIGEKCLVACPRGYFKF